MENWIDRVKEEATGPASEVIEHLRKALIAVPPFTLADGTVATVVPLYSPKTNADGQLHCGVDVNLGDSGHLEFKLTNTGWGRAMMGGFGNPKAKPSPKRGGRG